MRSFLLIFLSLVLFSQYSCKKNVPAPEAFFMKSDAITVSTSAQQGSGNHKITDLWVYVNGQFQGAYAVGNAIPIVSNNKSVRLNVLAGIKNNGIAGTRMPWIFYDILQFDTLVESGKTISRSFTFKYFPATTFTWTENFESNTVNGYTIEKSDISLEKPTVKSDGESLEGKYMELLAPGTSTLVQIQSTGEGFALPKASSNVYLEMNYKCNQEFEVGLMTTSTYPEVKPSIYLKAQPEWNKIYIQLANVVNTEPLSDKYKVYFRMLRFESDPVGRLCLDNIKLVYLP